MKNFSKRKLKKGFTLAELVITSGLMLLVAGLVISFIGFMSRFTDNNNVQMKKTEETLYFRENLDFWFSVFDKKEYTIVIGPFEENDFLLVRATNTATNVVYNVSFNYETDKDEKSRKVATFEFPSTILKGKLSDDGIKRIDKVVVTSIKTVSIFENDNPSTNITETKTVLRYIIPCKVAGVTYACEILY